MENSNQTEKIITGDMKQDVKRLKNRFDNRPISNRMKNAFGLMTFLILILAILSTFSLANMTHRLENFNSYSLKIVDDSWTARRNLLVAQNSIYKLCLTQDETLNTQYIEEEKAAIEAVDTALAELTVLDSTHTDLLTETTAKMNDMQDVRTQVIELGGSNQVAEAVAAIEKSYLPLVNDINNNLLTIADFAHQEAEAYAAQSQAVFIIFLVVMLVVVGFAIFECVHLSKRTIHGICDPLKQVEDALEKMSEGDLGFELTYQSSNEIGHMADIIRSTGKELKKYVDNIDSTLLSVANKDFDVSIDMFYKGDFYNIKESIKKIVVVLNDITGRIKETSIEVSKGSEDIAAVALNLSDGASEQSATVEELLATIQDVSTQVTDNAEKTSTVSSQSRQANEMIGQGNIYMQDLLTAMNDITENSNQISNIISVINQISNQTNLLALNASIEAARAGEHGKGFAVVANEIGELATQTNDATKSTASLIGASITAVQKGGKLTEQTAAMLTSVVGAAQKITELADDVSEASKAQAESLMQINHAVEQISDITQTNSSIAAEASASSSGLADQAGSLEQLMQEFKLKK